MSKIPHGDHILSRLHDAKELLEKAANIVLDVSDVLADPAFKPRDPGMRKIRMALEDFESRTFAATRDLDYTRAGSVANRLAAFLRELRDEGAV